MEATGLAQLVPGLAKLGGGLSIGLGALGTGIGMGILVGKAIEEWPGNLNLQDSVVPPCLSDYIAKPIDPGRMIETLAKWIVPAQPLARSAAPEEETVQKPETLPELPGVKVAEGVRRLGGNVESYYGILEKFRASQQDVIAEIRAALSGGDNATATRLVHALKGLAGTLGASALQNMAGELESVTRKGEHDKAISILSPIEIELNRLFVAIDSTLRQYKKRTGDKADTAPNASQSSGERKFTQSSRWFGYGISQ